MDFNQRLGIVACHICDKKPASNMGMELVKRCHYFHVNLTLWLIVGKSTNIFLCQLCCSQIHRYAVYIYETQSESTTPAENSGCRICSTSVGIVRTYLEVTTLRRKVLASIVDGNLDTTVWMCGPCNRVLRGIVALHDMAEITAITQRMARRTAYIYGELPKSLNQQKKTLGCLRKTSTDASTSILKKKVDFRLPKMRFSEQFSEVNEEVVVEPCHTEHATSSYSEATTSQSSLIETEGSDSGLGEEHCRHRKRNTSSTDSSELGILWENFDQFNKELKDNHYIPWALRNTANNSSSIGECPVQIDDGYVDQVSRTLEPNVEVTYDNKSGESAQLPLVSTCIVPNPPSTGTTLDRSESHTVINLEDEDHSSKVASVEEAQYDQCTESDGNLYIPWPIRNVASNSSVMGVCPVQIDYGCADEVPKALEPNVETTYCNKSHEYPQLPVTSRYVGPNQPSAYSVPYQPPTCIGPDQPPTYIEPDQPPTYIEPDQPPTYIEPYQPSTYMEPDQPSTYIEPDQPPTYIEPDQPSTYFETYQPSISIVPYQPPTYILPYQPLTYIVPYQPSTYIQPYQPSTYIEPDQPPTYIEPDQPSTYIEPDQPPTYIEPDQPSTYIEPGQPPTYIEPDQPSTYIEPGQPPTYIEPDQSSTYIEPYQPIISMVPYQPPTYIIPYQPSTYIEPYQPSTYVEPDQPPTYIEPDQPSTYIEPDQPPTCIEPDQPSTYIEPYQPSISIMPYQPSTYIMPYQPSTYIEPYQPSTYVEPDEPPTYIEPDQPSTCIEHDQPPTYIEPDQPSTYIEPYQPSISIVPYQPSTYIAPYQPSTYIVPYQPSTYIVPYLPATYIVPYQPLTYFVPYQPLTYIEPYQSSTYTTLDTSELAGVSNSEDDKHTTEVESVQEADKENP